MMVLRCGWAAGVGRDAGGSQRTPVTRGALAWLVVPSLGVALLAGCTDGDDAPASVSEALGYGAPDDPEANFEFRSDWTQRTEELIVECMAEQGFEYLPWGMAPSEHPRAGGSLTEEEYRERYGYGMMSSTEASIREKEGWGDPNEELRAAMDDATHMAWQTALYGEDFLDDETRDGCKHESEDEVNAHLFTDEWAELEPRLDELEARIAADPRTIAAAADWSTCMAEAGYPFANEDEAIHYIGEATHDAWEAEPHPETGLTPTNRSSITPWFVETDTWAELIAMELDIAARADACMEDPEVRAEYEQHFLEDNADLLDHLQEVR